MVEKQDAVKILSLELEANGGQDQCLFLLSGVCLCLWRPRQRPIGHMVMVLMGPRASSQNVATPPQRTASLFEQIFAHFLRIIWFSVVCRYLRVWYSRVWPVCLFWGNQKAPRDDPVHLQCPWWHQITLSPINHHVLGHGRGKVQQDSKGVASAKPNSASALKVNPKFFPEVPKVLANGGQAATPPGFLRLSQDLIYHWWMRFQTGKITVFLVCDSCLISHGIASEFHTKEAALFSQSRTGNEVLSPGGPECIWIEHAIVGKDTAVCFDFQGIRPHLVEHTHTYHYFPVCCSSPGQLVQSRFLSRAVSPQQQEQSCPNMF